MISPAGFAAGGLTAEDRGARALLADPVGLDADVAGGPRVERLLLRAHDRLERRVARLVDRVADGDHGGQLDVHGVVAVLGLALAAQLAVLHVDLDHLGERGHLQVVGHHGADRVALAVVRLLAEQHHVGRLGLEHLGQRVAGGAHVRAGQRVVGQVHRAVGAERHRLVQRAEGRLRPHGHGDDLVDLHGAALADLHGGLDRVGVEGVQVLLARAVEALGTIVHALLDGGVGHLFDEDADLHGKLLLRSVPARATGGCPRRRPIYRALTDESIAPCPRMWTSVELTRQSPRAPETGRAAVEAGPAWLPGGRLRPRGLRHLRLALGSSASSASPRSMSRSRTSQSATTPRPGT